MNVLVAGGSGFLGSHVADALSDAGHQVRIFDRRKSPYIRHDQKMIVGDLMNLDKVIEASKGCEAIYNFAGIADIEEAGSQPIETAKFNILGNLHLLEAAKLAGAKRFVFASSVYVYSNSGSFYRVSKQAAEQFVEAFHERYGLSYTILRYGSLYGRRADERNGIYRMLRDALEKKSISYSGSKDSSREYIHVTDAARLSVKILEEEYVNKHLILTGSVRMAVKDLVRLISEIVPGITNINFDETQKMDGHYVMTPYIFNPKVGHKLTAFSHVDLGQGILDTLAEIYENIEKNATPSKDS